MSSQIELFHSMITHTHNYGTTANAFWCKYYLFVLQANSICENILLLFFFCFLRASFKCFGMGYNHQLRNYFIFQLYRYSIIHFFENHNALHKFNFRSRNNKYEEKASLVTTLYCPKVLEVHKMIKF